VNRTAWKIAAAGGGVLVLGPLLGLVVTVAGLVLSFRAIENVDPAMKQQRLADGIQLSMSATAIGIAVFPIGAILLGVSLWQLLKKPRA
jgi:biopolymer transport protein ExbB/TolQ